jgi:hypothetical protein
MNIFNKVLLKAVLAPKKLYRQWGISIPQLQAILTYKLLMDDRRPNTIQQTRQQRNHVKKEISNSTIGTMLLSLLSGSFFLMVFMFGKDHITHLTLYFAMFITFLCMILISEFTSVLIDVRDNYIILPKPVSDKTFVLARLLHIFIHICKTVLPMAIPAILFLSYTNNVFAGIIFLALIFFVTLLCIFLINAVYIIILKVTTPEKFKNIISYIQIFFAIFIYAAYQLVPRMLGKAEMGHFEIPHNQWLILAPPYWFACAFNWLFTFHASAIEMLAAFIAIVFPVASIYIVVKYLAPSFNQKLSMISGSEGAPSIIRKKIAENGSQSFAEQLASLVTTSPVERTGFLFAWKMMARSREFKVKVYPGIGYILVIIVMMFFTNNKKGISLHDLRSENSQSVYLIIFSIYISSLLVLTAVTQMAYSDKFKAAWIFFITPVAAPGEIISGSIKAMLFQFYIVVVFILLIIGAILGGPSIIPNIFLGICNQLVIIYTIITIGYKELPFAKTASAAQRSGQFIRSIFMMLISFVIGALHYFIFKNTIAIVITFIVSALLLYFLTGNIKKTSWQKLNTSAENLG